MLLIYAVLCLLALIVGWSTFGSLNESLSTSMEANSLLIGFDRTTIFDIIHNNKNFISNIIGPIKWIIFLYLIASIFMNSGLLVNIVKGNNSIKTFLQNGWKHFLPFLGFSLITLLVVIVWTAFLFVPYVFILGNPITDYSTELPFLYSFFIVLFLWIIVLIWIFTWSVATKVSYCETPLFWRSLRVGFNTLKINIIKLTIWGIIIFIIHLLLLGVNLILNQMNSAASWTMTILTFVLMQVVVFKKIGVKAFSYSGIYQIVKQSK